MRRDVTERLQDIDDALGSGVGHDQAHDHEGQLKGRLARA
jgi:hypothetical protein